MWLPSEYLVFLLLFLYYAEATTTTRSISGGVNKNTNFQCLPGGSQNDWTYINNIGGPLYNANILRSGDLLNIHAVVSQHEGTYNCTANGQTSHNILTVLAVPKFDAQGCSPLSHCDLGTIATIPEGQPLPINITVDYVNGGAKGEKQSIEYSRIKRKGSGNNLVSCNQNNCQRGGNVLLSPRIQTDPWSIQANITDNRPLNVSRVYLVEIDVSEGSNVYTTITATFTIGVTPTSPAVSSTLMQDTSSDSVLTSTTFVMASLSSSSLLTSSLTTVPVSVITSPTNTVSSHSSSGGTSSGFTSTPSPSSPSSSSPSSSSPSSLSSSPPSSSSSRPPTATTVPSAAGPVIGGVDEKFMTLLVSIISAFIVTIIVVALLLAFLFVFLHSKRSPSVSGTSTVNSNDNVSNGSTGNSISLPEVTVVNSGIYSEIKDVSKRGDTNVIRNMHYVSTTTMSTCSNVSSSSSIEARVEPVYNIPIVNGNLPPEINSSSKQI